MSEYEQTLYDKIEGLLIKTRDYPQSETVSQLFADVNRKLDVLIIKTEATHEQACRTNGKVLRLEQDVAGIKARETLMKGKITGISIAVSSFVVIIGLLINYYK